MGGGAEASGTVFYDCGCLLLSGGNALAHDTVLLFCPVPDSRALPKKLVAPLSPFP